MALNLTELSRSLSHALRHEPATYGISLDAEGWVEVPALLTALAAYSPRWAALTDADLAEMIRQAKKQRHELRDGRIRALYGHSTPERIERVAAEPPAVLFHGTSPEAAARRGVVFCLGNERVWLADAVPTEFISLDAEG